jgi:hypothetical protein
VATSSSTSRSAPEQSDVDAVIDELASRIDEPVVGQPDAAADGSR